ncbi:hypothetical protein EZV62_015084 [Acer yangbiense]|uniref:Ubiquitin-like protease family profile domain-containing protein n=1 Tax=Acer yangbiense TaxID=1000413 RepID=A0A5C7HTV8_9ROSI|nr:hypothetical protein EZV62_015084 [Acer yangbiense]
MEVNRKYNAFVNDLNLLFHYIGIEASVSQSFFRELEDPTKWLGIEHVDAYINLLCKRKNDPMEKKQLKRKVAVVDCAFFVIVPCFVGGSHWVFSVVHLHNWNITIYDSNAYLLPNNPKYRQEQVLPLRRLFPLICKKSGYYDDSKRKKQGLTCMKAVRLAPYQFPCQLWCFHAKGNRAEEVFASLALPLINLVGLKTVEMAEEGRFTTIRVNTADSPDHGGRRNGVVFELPIESPVSVRREDHNNLELLQGLFDYMGIVFDSVESGVEELMQSLAAHMCNPMVEYVKGLKADMKFGTCMRLLATVEEMEMELRNGRLELEEAKKGIRVAEEGKVEALSKLNETHERVRRLNELLEFLSENKIEPRECCVPYKFLGMEEGQENDDKLL